MPTLWDTETNAPVEVSDKDALAALESGRYHIRDWDLDDQDRVQLVAPTGEVAPVPLNKLTTALAMGARIETEIDREKRELREREQDRANPITAAVAGFGDIASFGLLPQAMEAIGGEDYREQRKALEEAQPIATTVGRIAGAMVPGASIGRAVGTAAGGLAATRGLGALATGAAELGAAGAAEGAIVGGAELLSEDALGRADVLSQDLLSYVGGGALLGGGVGAALGLTGAALRKGIDRLTREAPKVQAARAQTLEAIAQDSEEASGWLRDKAADFTATLQGKDAEDIKKFLDPGVRGRAIRQAAQEGASQRFRDATAFKMAELLDEGGKQFQRVSDESIGQLKRANVAQVIDPESAGAASRELYGVLKQVQREVDDIVTSKDVYAGTVALRYAKQAKQYLNGMIPKVEEIGQRVQAEAATADDAADLFILGDKIKRKLGKWSKPGSFLQGADAEGVSRFRDGYELIRQNLENVKLYGGAAQAQKAINAQWAKLLESENFFRSQFVKKFGTQAWDPVYRTDPGRMLRYINTADGPESALAREALDNHINGQLALADAIERAYPVGDEIHQVAAAMRANGSKLKTVMADSYKKIEFANELRDLTASARFAAPGKLFNLGVILEDVSIKVGKKIGFDKIADATQKADSKITQAVKKAVKREVERAPRPPIGPGVGVFFETLRGERKKEKAKNLRSAYEARADELSSLVADPQGMADRIAANSADLERATPRLAASMAAKTAEAVQYLYQKLPKRPPQPTLTPLAQDWAPSMAEVSKFARQYTAAMDPLSVLDDLESGTLTREAVETIRTLYPDLHQKMLTKIQEQVGSRTEPLGYTDRVQLSILFGSPLDPSMQPERIAQYQQSVQGQAANPQPPTGMPPAPPPAPGQAGGGVRVQGLQKVTLGKSMQTRTQQISEAMT